MNPRPLLRGASRRRVTRTLVVSALALVAWACQDSTGPAARPDDGAAPRLGQASAFYCSTTTATAGGVHESRIPLEFPVEARATDGSVMEYRFRRQTPSGALTFSAECVIPRTMSAIETMNRRFQVPAELGHPRGRRQGGGEMTTLGCVEDGACALEPIVVVAPAPPAICDVNCGGTGGTMPGTGSGSTGWTGGAGGGGGGGSGSTSDNPAGEPVADDESVDCHGSDTGTCDKRVATADTVARAKELAETIRTDGICGEARNTAVRMIENGLEVWSNEVRQNGLLMLGDFGWKYPNPTGTEKVPVMHLWTDPRGFNAWTIAHEALHGMGKSHDTMLLGPDGVKRNMDQTAKYCSQS